MRIRTFPYNENLEVHLITEQTVRRRYLDAYIVARNPNLIAVTVVNKPWIYFHIIEERLDIIQPLRSK